MWLLINIIHEKNNYKKKILTEHAFDSFNWLAETLQHLSNANFYKTDTFKII